MNFQERIELLERRFMMPEKPLSLEPMHQILTRLIPKQSFRPEKTIIVAGTNGKGSTSVVTESVLLSLGHSVGLYTSPHLVCTTERFRINGRKISKELLLRALDAVDACSTSPLTHFETLTAAAAWLYFSPSSPYQPDWVILEVGLGGMWDATNAIDHQKCIITSLSYDHCELLGTTMESIAANKFGVVGQSNSVVYAPFPESDFEALETLRQKVIRETRSKWTLAPAWPHRWEGTEFTLNTPWGETRLSDSLLGKRGAQNTSLALSALANWDIPVKKGLSCLSHVKWPGRMSLFHYPNSPCPIYLSGDHNEGGIQSLLELLSQWPKSPFYRHSGQIHWIVGIGIHKEVEKMLETLMSIPNTTLTLTEPPFRGRRISEYSPTWIKRAHCVESSPHLALERTLQRAQPEDWVIVTGSLYLVGHYLGQT